MSLRPYQAEALASIDASCAAGTRRQLVSLPTGTGKTVLFANLPAIGLRRLLVVAHREELLDQAADKLRHWNPGLTVQVDQADRWADVETLSAFDGELFSGTGYAVCASVATIGRQGSRRLTRYPRDMFDTVIIDECFPAGTLVDGKPIESIGVGDVVWCRTGAGAFVRRPVTHRFVRSAPLRMVRFSAGGRSVVCTPNHPILTKRGWITAALLSRGDVVLCFTHAHRDALHGVHDASGHHGEVEDGHVQAVRPGLLLDDLSGCVGEPQPLEAHGGDEQEARLRADAREESDARSDGEGTDADLAPRAGMEAFDPTRKRSRTDRTAAATCVRARVADGGSDHHGEAEGLRIPYGAEGGHRERGTEDRDRGGRELPSGGREARGGRAEGRSSSWARVDRLEVLEPGSDGTFGGLCPDGLVYNLEVEEHHTYVANGVVVHNCHHSSAQSYQSVIDHFGAGKPGGPLLLGVTATPFRADGADLSKVYEKVVYSLELPDAISRGYLVDIRALAVATGVSLDGVGATREDFKAGELAEAVNTPERNARIVKAYLDHAAGRKGIVFAASVGHSKDLADAFLAAGIAARHVDGTTPGDERAGIFAWMREPGARVLCNVGVATEGYDEPSISVVLLARPTKSRVLYSQMIGRGTRLCDGKADLLVIDLADVSSKHTLANAAALFGLPTGLDLEGRSATKARARVKELVQEGLPFEELAKAKTLADLETIANEYRKVSLFWQPKTAPEVAGVSSLSWVSVGEGAIALRAGELRAWITTDMLGHAHLVLRRRPTAEAGTAQQPERLELAADFPTLAQAVGAADALIQNDQPKVLVDPKARWRRDPASEKQISLLKKFRVPFREPLTKGEAGILLDKAFARRGAAARRAS